LTVVEATDSAAQVSSQARRLTFNAQLTRDANNCKCNWENINIIDWHGKQSRCTTLLSRLLPQL